jgi:hypothetical protein
VPVARPETITPRRSDQELPGQELINLGYVALVLDLAR